MKNKSFNFLKRFAASLLSLSIFASSTPMIPTAYAGEVVAIVPVISAETGGYSTSVEVEDKNHLECDVINFEEIASATDINGSLLIGNQEWSSLLDEIKARGDSMLNNVNTPAKSPIGSSNSSNDPLLAWDNESSGVDTDRASEVATTLTSTMNFLVSKVVKTSSANTASAKRDNIKATLQASYILDPVNGTTVTAGGYTIVYSTDSTPGATISIEDSKVPANDGKGNLYCYIYDSTTDTASSNFKYSGMIWAMTKYESLSDEIQTSDSDLEYITCFMLAQYANELYFDNEIYSDKPFEPNSNFFTDIIAGLFEMILWAIQTILNLYDMDELIFNMGERGNVGFEGGIMQTNWWNIVLKYYTILQLIAWMIIAVAIVKSLVQINLGTIKQNSAERAKLLDLATKLITVGLLLALCIPILRLLMQINNGLVDIFAASYSGDMGEIPRNGSVIGQIAMGFFYLIMGVYTNFIYIMRAITLAILIASAPFFIVTIAFSGKQGHFDKWLKEVCANIFLQAFHAFAFSFLFEVFSSSGRIIETVVITFAIYPITDFFRSMIFGEAGSFAVSTGKQLGSMAKGMATSALGAAGGALGSKALGLSLARSGGAMSESGQVATAALSGNAGGATASGGTRSFGGGMSGAAGATTFAQKAAAVSSGMMENNEILDAAKGPSGTASGPNATLKDKIKSTFTPGTSQNASAIKAAGMVVGGLSSFAKSGTAAMDGFVNGDMSSARQGASAIGSQVGAGLVNGATTIAGSTAKKLNIDYDYDNSGRRQTAEFIKKSAETLEDGNVYQVASDFNSYQDMSESINYTHEQMQTPVGKMHTKANEYRKKRK